MKSSLFREPRRLEPTEREHRFGGSTEETTRVLGDLSFTNCYLGGTRSVLSALREPLASDRRSLMRLLDIGCGLADIPRGLARWARRAGVRLSIVGIDQDPQVVTHAAAASRAFPEIQIVRGDARDLPFRPGQFDYVCSSMLLHYFSSEEAVALLRAWGALASRGVIVNDVQRHWFPCLAISILARVSKSSLFREGSRRTVLRGFTPDEMGRLATQAGFGVARVRESFPFRLTLVARHERQ